MLTAAEVPEQLQDELRVKATSATARDGFVDFLFPDRELANEALDLLRAAHCEIESLAQTSSTLEEVFVRTVEK